MNREPIETGEIYHCYNRGVDKRTIYASAQEYSYFIHLLYVLNDDAPSFNTLRNHVYETNEVHQKHSRQKGDSRERLVDILAFVLMPNHYHLLLRQRVDDGIPKFMQKLGTGYTMYFNERHERSGALFQGRYKSVHINNDRQLLYIPHYIHLNPLGLLDRNDRGSTSIIKNTGTYLGEYKWSSYLDYVGGRAFPSVTERAFILDVFGGVKKYRKDIHQFIDAPGKLSSKIDPTVTIDSKP
jgi:putative transposase